MRINNWRGWPGIRPTRKFIQRGKRGWSDEDVWSFDFYINRVAGEGLRELAKNTHGYPADFKDMKEWQEYLNRISAEMLGWSDDTFADKASFDRAQGAWFSWAILFGGFWD